MANTVQVKGTFLTDFNNAELLKSASNLSILCEDSSPDETEHNYEFVEFSNDTPCGKLKYIAIFIYTIHNEIPLGGI